MTTKIAGSPGLEIDLVNGYPRIRGDFTTTVYSARVSFQTTTVDGATVVQAVPNGSSNVSAFKSVNSADANNGSFMQVSSHPTEGRLESGAAGSATFLPMAFVAGGAERMRLTPEGNLAVGTLNYLGANSPNRRHISIQGVADAGILQLSNSNPSTTIGNIEWHDPTNTSSASSRVGYITSGPEGATANNRGSFLAFATKQNGISGSGTECARFNHVGNLFIGTTINPLANSEARINMLANTSDGINIKHTVNGSNLINLWQTGTNQFIAMGFYKGDVQNSVGNITCTTTSTAYNTSSDYRLKDEITDLTGSGAFIDALQPRSWKWKANGESGTGFIAHELQVVSPSSVTGTKDEMDEKGDPKYQAVEYGSAEVIAHLVKEIQSLRQRVAALEAV